MRSFLRRLHAHRKVEAFIIRIVIPCVRWSMRVPLLGGVVWFFYEWAALTLVPQLDGSIILRVLDALEAGKVDYYLAGGYGIDALVGTASRFHGDLDIVLDRYSEQVEAAISIVERNGFHQIEPHPNLMWITDTSVFEDASGRTLELVGLDVERVVTASASLDGGELLHDLSDVTTTGEVYDKQVRCLSLPAQLVLQRGKPLRPKDLHNRRRIRESAR